MNTSTAVVSSSAIAGMIFSMIVTIIGPILLLIIWRVKKKCNLMPALAGALTFIIAALVLESIPKYFLFAAESPVSSYVKGHAFVFAVTGALLAGIFEECGRFVTFRYILKKHEKKETAITYGIGHGGIECILLIGIGMISNITLAFMINGGTTDAIIAALPSDQADVYLSAISTLTASTFGTFLWGVWERIFAMILHIALSVLVFSVSKDKSRFYFFPVAILLHALLDFPAALYQYGVIPLAVTEILIAVLACGSAMLAWREYRKIDYLPKNRF